MSDGERCLLLVSIALTATIPNPVTTEGVSVIDASCLCGAIRFQFPAAVGDFVYCHCRSCRKSSGSAFAANISVPIAGMDMLSGADNIGIFESSPGKCRHFCKTCASPLFTKVGPDPQVVRVRLGCLDTEFKQKPVAHIFSDDSAPWHDPELELPSYGQWPDAAEVQIVGSRQGAEKADD